MRSSVCANKRTIGGLYEVACTGRKREPTHMRLSGTDGLISKDDLFFSHLLFLKKKSASSANFIIAKRAAKNETLDQENPVFEGQTKNENEKVSAKENGENPAYEGGKEEEVKPETEKPVVKPKPAQPVKKERLKSLDTFRG